MYDSVFLENDNLVFLVVVEVREMEVMMVVLLGVRSVGNEFGRLDYSSAIDHTVRLAQMSIGNDGSRSGDGASLKKVRAVLVGDDLGGASGNDCGT